MGGNQKEEKNEKRAPSAEPGTSSMKQTSLAPAGRRSKRLKDLTTTAAKSVASVRVKANNDQDPNSSSSSKRSRESDESGDDLGSNKACKHVETQDAGSVSRATDGKTESVARVSTTATTKPSGDDDDDGARDSSSSNVSKHKNVSSEAPKLETCMDGEACAVAITAVPDDVTTGELRADVKPPPAASYPTKTNKKPNHRDTAVATEKEDNTLGSSALVAKASMPSAAATTAPGPDPAVFDSSGNVSMAFRLRRRSRNGDQKDAAAATVAATAKVNDEGLDSDDDDEAGMNGQHLRVLKRVVAKEDEEKLKDVIRLEFADVLVCDEPLEENREENITSQAAKFNRVYEERFMELLIFYKAYGHLHVPKLYPDNPALGRWVVKLRSWRKKRDPRLTASRLNRLNKVGFIWEPKSHADFWKVQGTNKKAEDLWELNFAELCDYRQAHGDCLVPKEFPPNQRLARWVTKQRKHFKAKREGRYHSLDDEKERRLFEVGFVFNTKTKELMRDSVLRRYEDRWEEFCDRLVNFKKEFGHTAVPRRWKRDTQLASWVMRQRFQWRKLESGQHSYLTSSRLQRLTEVGFVFGEVNRQQYPVVKKEEGNESDSAEENADFDEEMEEEGTEIEPMPIEARSEVSGIDDTETQDKKTETGDGTESVSEVQPSKQRAVRQSKHLETKRKASSTKAKVSEKDAVKPYKREATKRKAKISTAPPAEAELAQLSEEEAVQSCEEEGAKPKAAEAKDTSHGEPFPPLEDSAPQRSESESAVPSVIEVKPESTATKDGVIPEDDPVDVSKQKAAQASEQVPKVAVDTDVLMEEGPTQPPEQDEDEPSEEEVTKPKSKAAKASAAKAQDLAKRGPKVSAKKVAKAKSPGPKTKPKSPPPRKARPLPAARRSSSRLLKNKPTPSDGESIESAKPDDDEATETDESEQESVDRKKKASTSRRTRSASKPAINRSLRKTRSTAERWDDEDGVQKVKNDERPESPTEETTEADDDNTTPEQACIVAVKLIEADGKTTVVPSNYEAGANDAVPDDVDVPEEKGSETQHDTDAEQGKSEIQQETDAEQGKSEIQQETDAEQGKSEIQRETDAEQGEEKLAKVPNTLEPSSTEVEQKPHDPDKFDSESATVTLTTSEDLTDKAGDEQAEVETKAVADTPVGGGIVAEEIPPPPAIHPNKGRWVCSVCRQDEFACYVEACFHEAICQGMEALTIAAATQLE